MKRFWFLSFLLSTVLSFPACGGDEPDNLLTPPEQPGNPSGGDNPDPGKNAKYLIVFASRSGNTERVAQQIRTVLDCDMLEVEPQTAYESDYDAMLGRARAELAAIREGNCPAVRTSVESFEGYDLVFVGYPVWHGSMATTMQAFLHNHASKLTGKRIALFATSGGSGISTSVNEAKALCAEAAVESNTLLLTSLTQVESRVAAWLGQLGASREENNNNDNNTSMKVKMTVGGRTVTATMEDHAAGRDFLARLPLEVTLADFNNTTEKIFYPSPALTIEGVTRGCAPVAGDITIYVPWGNVAIFCKNWPQSRDLVRIGHIDGDGISVLSAYSDEVVVKFERN